MSRKFEYDVFLSHNKADKPRVRMLAERMRAEGMRVWFDEWVIQPGDDIYLAVERGLEAARTLVLCLSPAALGSDWVTLERSTALFRDPSNIGRRFIPLLLDDCEIPDTLKRYKYVDYRNETQTAFDQVLTSLRPQEKSATVQDTSQTPQITPVKSEQEIQWEHADEVVRKNLPPGVKLVRTLRGHTGWIGHIAWSPDGRMLASPSKDETIRLWDAEIGKCLRTLTGHKDEVMTVAFSPNGKILASGGGNEFQDASDTSDRSIYLWDTTTGELVKELGKHSMTISALAFDQTGQMLASASFDATINLWEIAKAKQVWIVGTPASIVNLEKNSIFSLAFDRKGQRFVVGGKKNGIEFCRLIDGKIVRSLKGHGWATTTALDYERDILATAGGDSTVCLWDMNNGRLLSTLEGHTDAVVSLGFVPDGKLLISKGRCEDSTIRLWNTKTGACVATISEPMGLYYSPALNYLY